MGQIITNFRNDNTGLDAWKDVVPVVIGRMLDEKQVGRYQQEIRKLNEKLIETGEDNPDRFETQKQITKLSITFLIKKCHKTQESTINN